MDQPDFIDQALSKIPFDLFIAAAVSVISFLAGRLYNKIGTSLSSKIFRRAIRVAQKDQHVCVVAPTVSTPIYIGETIIQDISDMVEIGERKTFYESFAAAPDINGILLKMGAPIRSITFCLSEDFIYENAKFGGMVLLGGPNHNSISEKFLNMQKLNGRKMYFPEDPDGPAKYSAAIKSDFDNGQTYECSYTMNSNGANIPETDYAIVALIDAPEGWENVGERVLLVAGCHGIASIGVFRDLHSGALLKTIRKHKNFRRGHGFWAIVKVDVQENKWGVATPSSSTLKDLHQA